MLRKHFSVLFSLCLILFPVVSVAQPASLSPTTGIHTFAPSSALSEHRWVRISITETGIYQITDAELRKMGFSDPSKVGVYGFGGYVLDEAFSTPHIDDLPEVPVYRDDANKRTLFYGRGLIRWTLKDSKSIDGEVAYRYTQSNNIYANEACYFLRQKEEAPQSMEITPSLESGKEVTTFDDYAIHEKDETNVGGTGREMYGESLLYTRSQNFRFSCDGIVDTPGYIDVDFIINTSDAGGRLAGSVTGASADFMNALLPSGADKYQFAKSVSGSYVWSNPVDHPTVGLTFKPGGNGARIAMLNYIRLNFKRKLQLYGSYTLFRRGDAGYLRYLIGSQPLDSRVQVWDVTDPVAVSQQETKLFGGISGFVSPQSGLREFALVNTQGQFPSALTWTEVAPQNLHALPQTDMVIIVQPKLKAQAERLADYRRTKDNLHVTVVTPQEIYNEFSSGTADVTAYRLFMKMFYDRSFAEGMPPAYLLLFGDGANDNRGIESARWKKSVIENCLLTYQSAPTLIETESYVCDDYFGFLDDNEGGKKDSYGQLTLKDDYLDLGIGRLPVRTLTEAKNVVDKIIGYSENKVTGKWKNNLCFLGDDGDNNTHMRHAEQMVQLIQSNGNQEFVFNRIYLDAYKRENTASGTAYPVAKQRFFDQLNQGSLLVNYSGHGATTSITHEKLFMLSDAQSIFMKRLPVWVTATCDFSRFDHHDTSAGEALLLNPGGGAAALFTTTRVVFSNGNLSLNRELIRNLFVKHDDGTRYRMGDVMRLAKRALKGDSNKLNFLLLGDPSMFMGYPEYRMEITHVNDVPVGDTPFLMKALSRVTMKGRILELGTDQTADDFDGILYPTVYDSEEDVTTLDNDGTGPYKYKDRTRKLFAGSDSVKNGIFEFSFIVPKDISYSQQRGMVNLYASQGSQREAQGYFDGYIIGGTADEITEDTTPPVISTLYLNNDSFREGATVNTTPYLFAEIEDDVAINASGASIGHDMTATIYSETLAPVRYVLNEYFVTAPGCESKGTVGFSIPELPEGSYTLELKVWDVYNNSSVRSIGFVVMNNAKPVIFDLRTLQNPVREEVQFILSHDRPETTLKAKIQVYTQMGQCVWEFEVSGRSDFLTSLPVTWDLCKDTGERIAPGLYIYRASLSSDGQHYATKGKKLIVLGQ